MDREQVRQELDRHPLGVLVRQLQGLANNVKRFHGPFSATFTSIAAGGSSTVVDAHNLNIVTTKQVVLGLMRTAGFGERLSVAYSPDTADQVTIHVENVGAGTGSGVFDYFIVELI